MVARRLALLIGMLVIGGTDALAINAPLPVDAQDDLFAAKPKTPPADPVASQPDPVPPAARPAQPVAAPAAERPAGNPLWAIPLNRLNAWRERPLFAPTRRPPMVAVAPKPAPAPPAPPPPPPEPEKPQLSLLGTIAGGSEPIGLFLDATSKAIVRLKAGENHRGWILRAVSARQVELAKGLDSALLDMPQRRDTSTAGAAGGMTQSNPPPAGMPAVATTTSAVPGAAPAAAGASMATGTPASGGAWAPGPGFATLPIKGPGTPPAAAPAGGPMGQPRR